MRDPLVLLVENAEDDSRNTRSDLEQIFRAKLHDQVTEPYQRCVPCINSGQIQGDSTGKKTYLRLNTAVYIS